MSLVSSPCSHVTRSGPETRNRPSSDRSRQPVVFLTASYPSMRYPDRIMTRSRTWSIALLMAGAWLAVSYSASAQTNERREARYRIFIQGVPVGGETVVVETSATEWKMTAAGQINATTYLLNKAEIRYDREWRPLGFVLDARIKDSPVRITTMIEGSTATSSVIQGDKSFSASHQLSEHAIIIPSNVTGA